MATVKTNAALVVSDLSAWAEFTGQELGQSVASAALQVFNSTMTRTPVDEGRLRGNWQMTINREASGTVDRNASAATSEAQAIAQSFKDGSLFITNNVPYAAVVEFGLYPGNGPKTSSGFSKQAPRGMLRISVAEFDSALRKAVRKANNS